MLESVLMVGMKMNGGFSSTESRKNPGGSGRVVSCHAAVGSTRFRMPRLGHRAHMHADCTHLRLFHPSPWLFAYFPPLGSSGSAPPDLRALEVEVGVGLAF
ncbi:hypothetical protein ACLOJK_029983 [Asimina triloba]